MLKIDEELNTITISLEEYKELLIIKGKYEELKELYVPKIYPSTITFNGNELKPPYNVTCRYSK